MHYKPMTHPTDMRELRSRLNWTQADMAKYLGIDRSSVSRIESGGGLSGPVRKLLGELAANPPGSSLPATGGASASPSLHREDEAA